MISPSCHHLSELSPEADPLASQLGDQAKQVSVVPVSDGGSGTLARSPLPPFRVQTLSAAMG